MTELDSDGDELFSMEDLEKGLKKGRARRTPWFVAGLVLGIAGTVAVPRFLSPYLPNVFGGGSEILSGPVLAEERDGDRLLLTILAEPGAMIASFTERVSEIAMLVAPGDTVTIAVDDYEPFVENPDFEGVRKGSGMPSAGTGAPADTTSAAAAPDSTEGGTFPPDSAAGPASRPGSTSSEGG